MLMETAKNYYAHLSRVDNNISRVSTSMIPPIYSGYASLLQNLQNEQKVVENQTHTHLDFMPSAIQVFRKRLDVSLNMNTK